MSPDFFLNVNFSKYTIKSNWFWWFSLFDVFEFSSDRKLDVRQTLRLLWRRVRTPLQTAATLKFLRSASIYQPRSTRHHLRFRTCLWNCDETINYFEVYCKPAAKLKVCLESIANSLKHDVLFFDVVVEHEGVQRLIFLIADCWFLCSSYVWRGPEVEFLF